MSFFDFIFVVFFIKTRQCLHIMLSNYSVYDNNTIYIAIQYNKILQNNCKMREAVHFINYILEITIDGYLSYYIMEIDM